jgi:hypothetical protein
MNIGSIPKQQKAEIPKKGSRPSRLFDRKTVLSWKLKPVRDPSGDPVFEKVSVMRTSRKGHLVGKNSALISLRVSLRFSCNNLFPPIFQLPRAAGGEHKVFSV